MTDAERFLRELFKGSLPLDQRAITCGFLGDPSDRRANDWRPHAWSPGAPIPFVSKANAYVCVSSFYVSTDGTWRRRREHFAGAWGLMIDDLGTKVHLSVINALSPSALIETSPGNFQAWYFFAEPMPDMKQYAALGEAFIAKHAAGIDPGMAGFNRVGRLPGFVNGKAKYSGFVTLLHSLDAHRYTPEQVAAAFGLDMGKPRRSAIALYDELYRPRGINPTLQGARIDAFRTAYRFLKQRRMMKGDSPDLGDWVAMVCPWKDEHTGGADSGAALRLPHEDNGYHGAFRCHHGHCADKGWRELTDWINDIAAEELAAANEGAIADGRN
jgi:hypothetical protein